MDRSTVAGWIGYAAAAGRRDRGAKTIGVTDHLPDD
jgi:hypothetical protein